LKGPGIDVKMVLECES